MTDPQHDNRPASAAARMPRTWDFMETLFVALVAYAVYEGMGSLAYAALVAMHDSAPRSPAVLRTLDEAASLLACGATIAVLWAATRMAGRDFAEYLALNWPNRNDLLLAFAVMAVLVAVQCCGLALQIFSPFSSCRRSWRIVCSVGRPLAGRADHGGICFPGLHVSRVVRIIPRAGRSHRSDISIVCALPYPIRLACTPLYFFGWILHCAFFAGAATQHG